MRSRLFALATTVSLVVAVGIPSASSARPPTDDGSQPLPGYTVQNPPLPPVLVGGTPTTVYQGIFGHAAFDIEVPPNWNGDLAMYAHGYRGQGNVLTVDPPPFGLRQRLVDQGYAWAASSYYDNGYDVQAGVLSTHDLTEHFEDLVDPADRVYLIGVSMGGHISGRSIEDYPHFYAGALPMCGVLGDNELFDFFLDENLVAQDLADVPAFPPPADYLTNQVPRSSRPRPDRHRAGGAPTNALGQRVPLDRHQPLRRHPSGRRQRLLVLVLVRLPVHAVDARQRRHAGQKPGRLATNVGTDYEPKTPRRRQRHGAARAPADRVDRVRATASPNPRRSRACHRSRSLSLHDLGDLFVPFSMEEIYAAEVSYHGRSKLLVQRAIRAANHCEFSANEAGQAWDDLATWVHDRPTAGRRRRHRPRRRRGPNFGCAFTDPPPRHRHPPCTRPCPA